MRPTRTYLRNAAVTLAVTGLAAGTLFAAHSAQAAPTVPATPAAANAVAHNLGASSAGSYVDASGRTVVTVTNAAAAAQVRAAGATPKLVKFGAAHLNAVTSALNGSARIAGTAWAVDPMTDQVVVSVDQTVTGAKLAKVKAATAKYGSAARIERVADTFTGYYSTNGTTWTQSGTITIDMPLPTTSSPPGTAATSRPPGTATRPRPHYWAAPQAAASRAMTTRSCATPAAPRIPARSTFTTAARRTSLRPQTRSWASR